MLLLLFISIFAQEHLHKQVVCVNQTNLQRLELEWSCSWRSIAAMAVALVPSGGGRFES